MPITVASITDQKQYPHQTLVFSGGEVHVKFGPDIQYLKDALILAYIHSSNDLMEMLLVTDALRQASPTVKIELLMPYIPYARQDRVCVSGEALSIKVLANIINAQKYDTVTVVDPHSDVSAALLDRVVVMDQAETFSPLSDDIDPEKTVLVAPDSGALKKIHEFAKRYGFKQVVRADKERDVQTGKITATEVHSGHVGDKDFLIVDDICDGGRTFLELAKELRPLTNGKIILYVTHGIFSKGLEAFKGVIDEVYCAHPFNPEHNQYDNLLK